MLILGCGLKFSPMEGFAASYAHRGCAPSGCFPTCSQLVRFERTSCQALRVKLLSSWTCCEFSALKVTNLKENLYLSHRSMKFNRMGALLNTDSASAFDWVPLVDQVLLMASIYLTHLAGVLAAKKSFFSSRNGLLNDNAISGDSTLLGSTAVKHEEINSKVPWDTVEEKLTDALKAIEQGHNLVNRAVNFEGSAKIPLSLYAVAEGPRVRLLLACFQWLKQEVDNISGRVATVKMNDWSKVMCELFQKSCQPVFVAWLEKELCLKSKNLDKDLPSVMLGKLMGDDSVSRNIRNSGKEDLYAELAQFLIFGSLSEGCCYDCRLFMLYGGSILEDLVITLADGVASAYLELISVDSSMSNEVNCIDLGLCTLSTRELQKLRNEVALNQWLHLNVKAIVSMYEDRFDLCTLQSQLIEESRSGTDKCSWWKRLTLGKSAAISPPLRIFAISYISVTVRRTKELRALTGWGYYFSLFLELADITMPLIGILFAKVSDAISFLLVSLIGRSLGLIYTGIRQSLRWKS